METIVIAGSLRLGWARRSARCFRMAGILDILRTACRFAGRGSCGNLRRQFPTNNPYILWRINSNAYGLAIHAQNCDCDIVAYVYLLLNLRATETITFAFDLLD